MSLENLANRLTIIRKLREELVGPSPQGKELDCSKAIQFDSFKDSYGPWKQNANGEEILQRDSPTKRYGIGVLYPPEIVQEDSIDAAGEAAIGMYGKNESVENDHLNSPLTKDGQKDLDKALNREIRNYEDESNDLDLSASNTYRPSSMGISFLASIELGTKIIVESPTDTNYSGIGRYKPLEVQIKESGRPSIWWSRVPIQFRLEFDANELMTSRFLSQKLDETHKVGPIDLHVEVYARKNPYASIQSEQLITICLVNRSESGNRRDELCAFQSTFTVRVVSASGKSQILPYPEAHLTNMDDEEKSIALLYRNYKTYATGHGCSANWSDRSPDGQVQWLKAECLPTYEAPSTTPDIVDENGIPAVVSMVALAGPTDRDNYFSEINRLIELYKKWISNKRDLIANLPDEFHDTANQHLDDCVICVERMREGVQFLESNPTAMEAFRLANYAILLQQLTARQPRTTTYNFDTNRWEFSEEYIEPDINTIPEGRGNWRAFQVAFLLMSLQSSVDAEDRFRETVELIWFPTGGGKTEAYLGLTAFSLFMRRLMNPNDSGVHVITRYTLRLLTAQQFQRATKLICAMELIRRDRDDLGQDPFTIGIWVGGSNTPNRRSDAISILGQLNKGDRFTENKFILGQCPWCGSQMGPITNKVGKKWKTKVAGYIRKGKTVEYRCVDSNCNFHRGLPVYSIDEDIYEFRPSVVIGTVDKFATLAWRPEARTLFGIDEEGKREISPPGLIIQDELHLISGPLGSMVGLYETVIEELCSDRRYGSPIKPKIVSSTATIRRYKEQTKALYGRENVTLFPPSGLDADDSFFAQYARDDTGKLRPGRTYVGIHGPGLGSLQTVQVRTFTSLMQAPINISSDHQKDPWWTLLIFFNSLRELGTTLSLFQSDIPDYLIVNAQRHGIAYSSMRKLWRIRELTGRLRSDEVPEAISALEVPYDDSNLRKPVDACLASNILEVGVDIDRLSIMSVVGQPKSTSQYIQVTGRVGRRWWERPGLVLTIYSASKPRDRSHFEKFRTYHERLYSQVEPVSVTPFSPPALDRALHAVMVVYARQFGDKRVATSPYPYPENLIEHLREILLPRVRMIDKAEVGNFIEVFNRRAKEWKRWNRTGWEKRSSDENYLLLRAGEYVEPESKLLTWQTPTSMRTVDAECEAKITALYLQDEGDDE